MSIFPTVLQSLFALSQYPQSLKFFHSFERVKDIQENILRGYLKKNAETYFGREHGFRDIRDIHSYRRQVPVRSYEDFLPYIQKIQRGRQNVLTAEPVLMFHPTGGTSGTKLIPYTLSLKQEFQRALAPWLVDVFRHFPKILNGRSYWTISPPGQKKEERSRETQSGFEEDASYFGWKGHFLQHMFAVPSWVTRSESIEHFRFLTLFFLLQAEDLSWMSLWSPTFLLVLLEEMDKKAEDLLASLHEGQPRLPKPANASLPYPGKVQPERAEELEKIFSLPVQQRYQRIWPKLSYISLWKDAYARHPAKKLEALFPDVYFQGKGLLATEGVITFPLYRASQAERTGCIPALTSHFLEFLSEEHSEACCVWELEEGQNYSILLTTGGGLYRYEIGDLLKVEGFYKGLPLLRFLGRKGRFFDFAGEKLAEQFVNDCLEHALRRCPINHDFLLIAPQESEQSRGYTLFLESSESFADVTRFAQRIEDLLRQNFHYRLAVDLKQIAPLRLFLIKHNAQQDYLRRCLEAGQKLGDIKPALFDCRSGWEYIFTEKDESTRALCF